MSERKEERERKKKGEGMRKLLTRMKNLGSEGVAAAETLLVLCRDPRKFLENKDSAVPQVPHLKHIVKDNWCSKTFEKRLDGMDDVWSLFLPKSDVEHNIFQFLKSTENLNRRPAVPVIVYDVNGTTYEMMLRRSQGGTGYRLGNGGRGGWTEFYQTHGLAHQQIISVCAFRHKENDVLCIVLMARRDEACSSSQNTATSRN
ncbi:hypothetical protein VNO77_32950 [Canavalia gladiata]|uniref:TF-B3 domain-containing protein n=1 Tax=Canavalia gladiata TaxID=3824 RepID=A0AAN9KBH5_CANGL